MIYAPIILFVYNRAQHTYQTLLSLSRNYLANESEIFIFADGPKINADADQLKKISDVRDVIRKDFGFKKVTIIEAESNKGLAPSVIAGVTKIVNEYGKCIVVEDDLETSKYFLTYMNEALKLYEKEESVACIHGYVEPHSIKLPETFFLKGADCWGWATWKRAWDKFNPNGQELLNQLHSRKCEKHFNFDNTYNYIQMLEDQIVGKNSSWAIRWLASAYLNDMYCLYPNQTLVRNIGFDGSGTHCGNEKRVARKICESKVELIYQKPEECRMAWIEYKKYFKKQKGSLLYRGINKIKNVIHKKGIFK